MLAINNSTILKEYTLIWQLCATLFDCLTATHAAKKCYVLRCVISITPARLTHLKRIQILNCLTFLRINLSLFKIVNDALDILRIRNSLMEKWRSYIWYAAKHSKVIPDECLKYFIKEIIKCRKFYPLENHMLFRNN